MGNKDTKLLEIKTFLPNSELIKNSPYTVEQWESIIMILPDKQLDELYAFLLLENKQKDA